MTYRIASPQMPATSVVQLADPQAPWLGHGFLLGRNHDNQD